MRHVFPGLVLLFLAAACGGSVASVGTVGAHPDGGAGLDAAVDRVSGDDADVSFDTGSECHGRVPLNHRADAAPCPTVRAPGGGPYSDSGVASPECNQDSDCTMGQNGRCLVRTFGARVTYCSYDACFADSDCAGNVPCDCRASPSSDPNVCGTGSNCRVDSDCGPCGFCSPSDNGSICGDHDTEYFCHTGSDTCVDDSDCAPSDTGCNFDPQTAHWACITQCSPPPP
jgi:hypothetical protein